SKESKERNAHFIVLSTDEDVELEGYTYSFYDSNIKGVGEVFDCAALTINMSTRRVAVDCFGELRTMISDSDLTTIREAFTPELTDGDYPKAASRFLEDAGSLVERRREEYNIEIPEADPDEFLYDYAGALTDSQKTGLAESLKSLSERSGIDYLVLILESDSTDYLERFSSSFYRQNISGKSERSGAYILALSEDYVAVAPFGSYDPENDVIWDDEYYTRGKLSEGSIYDACSYFAKSSNEMQVAENEPLPDFDPAGYVFDYAGELTPADIEALSALASEKSEKLNTHFYFIVGPNQTGRAAYKFDSNFVSKYRTSMPESSVILLIGKEPLDGEDRVIDFYPFGDLAYRKLGYKAMDEVASLKEEGSARDIGELYIITVAKELSFWIPDIRMIDRLPQVLMISFLVALGASFLLLAILRIAHSFGLKSKPPVERYMVADSLSLHYKSDRFVSTHTSKTLIEKSSSSSGGGGSSGSSGGGHSSRSEGSF
ncbi:MAG: TPM domain-containing protein, partial [Clostridiales bacterium]|nr:TPM domain-containing protein [Clostridiales bacterium]